jgi:hypothetical protein
MGLPEADTDTLLEYLGDRVGDAVRSCVEYTPESSTVHYLRDDIDGTAAEARLVRVAGLYQASRLAADPDGDRTLGRLHASVHLFGGALVLHLLDSAGRAVGVSLDPSAGTELVGVVAGCSEALYGTLPDGFPTADGADAGRGSGPDR